VIIFLLWAVVLILFWPLALLNGLVWLALLLLRMSGVLVVLTAKGTAVIAVSIATIRREIASRRA
jgi:hypothetical protein